MRGSTEIGLLGSVAATGIGLITWILLKSRRSPAEREKRRRAVVAQNGRMGDGFITDVNEDWLYYKYTVRGAEYEASQELGELRQLLPERLETVIGPATIKFLPENPGNSIVVGEEWYGIRAKESRVLLKGA